MFKKFTSSQKTPADIAKETIRQLAAQRIAPTPEAYSKLYNEIAGTDADSSTAPAAGGASVAENLLAGFADSMLRSKGELSTFGNRLVRAAQAGNWEDYQKTLDRLTEHLTTAPAISASAAPLVPAAASAPVVAAAPVNVAADDNRQRLLKDLLYRTLTLALCALLRPLPDLANESESLGMAVRNAASEPELNDIGNRLKQLCFQIELQSGDVAEQQELLLRLFDLLLSNIHDLLESDSWIRGQIEVVKALIAGPLDHRALQEATRSLKDVIYKQGTLKSSIEESRTSVKNMMKAFLDRLDAMAKSTGQYQNKMDGYAAQITQVRNPAELQHLIGDIVQETRTVHNETLRSRDVIVAAQKQVTEAEAKIKDLEQKLEQMSEMVREDQLTGSLNRRGMDDLFEREADRADRRRTPLCVALLDLDNFKRLNDTHGHAAGDEALIHLVRIVKQTLRSIDAVARYGGEEFVIIMPDTSPEEAAQAMTRVQRELTTHFFTANDQRLFITFSCGVALRKPHETQESLIQRADQAMYEAKRTGKNKVVLAA
ncbi:GGDEF domain-containing protein [Undibacterium luofuense]|uniref:diguanylate cyclase n=1 Tax=Undibacterium luofuense TaxID=2828733 RepID=A0A941I6U2_9BURK|nr:GGDEF domain-containing protein [Undibacterium luofuense]MBR7783041.1 GGDEF domain-containing protein [Undibacterium luofuense]